MLLLSQDFQGDFDFLQNLMLDLSLSENDVPSFFLDGVGDNLNSLLEESSASVAFDHSLSPYPNPTYWGLSSTSSG
jgi:hypothetical protein